MTRKNFNLSILLFMQLLQISYGSSLNMIHRGLTLQEAWKQIGKVCPQLVTKQSKKEHFNKVYSLLNKSDPEYNTFIAGFSPIQDELDEDVANFCKLELVEVQKLQDRLGGGGVKSDVSNLSPDKLSEKLSELPDELSYESDHGQENFSFVLNRNFSIIILFLFGLVCGLLIAFFYFTRFPLLENPQKTTKNLRRPEL